MAHKKGGGSTRNGRDSNPQYRGVKTFGGATVGIGHIIVRQCGSVYKAGKNVRVGRDWTLFSMAEGVVSFHQNGKVDVVPTAAAAN